VLGVLGVLGRGEDGGCVSSTSVVGAEDWISGVSTAAAAAADFACLSLATALRVGGLAVSSLRRLFVAMVGDFPMDDLLIPVDGINQLGIPVSFVQWDFQAS